MDFDKDLQSIQEVRWLVAKAVVAQKELAKMSQQQVDGIAKAIADACAAQSERLAKMAVEETGFGIWQDKVLKNLLGSAITWDSVKDMKTVGIIKDDRQNGLMEVGVPMGVVAALIPSTNPTSTTMYKSIISIKAGNAIVISPHPNAKNCIIETAKVICEAARKASSQGRCAGGYCAVHHIADHGSHRCTPEEQKYRYYSGNRRRSHGACSLQFR